MYPLTNDFGSKAVDLETYQFYESTREASQKKHLSHLQHLDLASSHPVIAKEMQEDIRGVFFGQRPRLPEIENKVKYCLIEDDYTPPSGFENRLVQYFDDTCHDVASRVFQRLTGTEPVQDLQNEVFDHQELSAKLDQFLNSPNDCVMQIDLLEYDRILHSFVLDKTDGHFHVHNHFIHNYSLIDWTSGHYDSSLMLTSAIENEGDQVPNRNEHLKKIYRSYFTISSAIKHFGNSNALTQEEFKNYSKMLVSLFSEMGQNNNLSRKNELAETLFGTPMWFNQHNEANYHFLNPYDENGDPFPSCFVNVGVLGTEYPR